MTAEMAIRFIASDMDLIESVKVIMVLRYVKLEKLATQPLTVVVLY
jgi:hypothetical protein